jgi:hypothetical protein
VDGYDFFHCARRRGPYRLTMSSSSQLPAPHDNDDQGVTPTRSLPPGLVSRLVAILLAGVLAFMLQQDFAEYLANPTQPEPAVVRPEIESILPAEDDPVPLGEVDETPADQAPVTIETPEPPVVEEENKPVAPGEPQQPSVEVTPPVAEQEQFAPVSARVAERFALLVEWLENDDEGHARLEAMQILDELGGSEAVIEALMGEKVPGHRARLLTVHALLLADHEEEARRVARQAKLSHPDDPTVVETIDELKILRPRIVDLDSFVNDRQRLVLKGTVRNEDVGAVRKIRVRGDALDGEGNVIASSVTQVKPRLIASDLAGEFEIRFKGVSDHSQISRTRATVIAYEYEVVHDE